VANGSIHTCRSGHGIYKWDSRVFCYGKSDFNRRVMLNFLPNVQYVISESSDVYSDLVFCKPLMVFVSLAKGVLPRLQVCVKCICTHMPQTQWKQSRRTSKSPHHRTIFRLTIKYPRSLRTFSQKYISASVYRSDILLRSSGRPKVSWHEMTVGKK